MKIQVYIDKHYGTERIYPANQEGELFAQLVGQRTLTRHNIEVIKDLGYEVQVVQREVSL